MNAEPTILNFIRKQFVSRRGGDELTATDSLLNSGVIDSTAIFKLVGFLEQEFGIEVRDEDIVPEHFETVRDVAAFVESRRRS